MTKANTYLLDLLLDAFNKNASDVHLRRFDNADTFAAMRIDGVMQKSSTVPPELAEQVFGRIKYLANLKTYQQNYPQEGRIPGAEVGMTSDLRVSCYPAIDGEKTVIRFFKHEKIKALDELNFSDQVEEEIRTFLAQRSGLMLITGPAGSGKTSTIYGCLAELALDQLRNIVTIEDPAEQIIPGIMQTETNDALHLGFPEALRHLLRQDPEVIAIGEIRDEETAAIAVRCAFTGHLVIATLHAGSCKRVIERLFDMCVDKYAALSAVELIINQRLLRKKCGGGYQGRVPVAETLKLDEEIRKKIRDEGIDGIKTSSIYEDAQRLIDQKISDRAEVERMLGVREKDHEKI